jgi:hypothetical protein
MKLLRQDRTPTVYGFGCGYTMQEFLYTDSIKVELYREHSTYHVRFVLDHRVRLWRTYEDVKEARKVYYNLRRVYLKAPERKGYNDLLQQCTVEEWAGRLFMLSFKNPDLIGRSTVQATTLAEAEHKTACYILLSKTGQQC